MVQCLVQKWSKKNIIKSIAYIYIYTYGPDYYYYYYIYTIELIYFYILLYFLFYLKGGLYVFFWWSWSKNMKPFTSKGFRL